MTRKHFIFAADQIVEECYANGVDREHSLIYQYYLEFFKHFSNTFSQDTFDNYIDNKLNEMH